MLKRKNTENDEFQNVNAIQHLFKSHSHTCTDQYASQVHLFLMLFWKNDIRFYIFIFFSIKNVIQIAISALDVTGFFFSVWSFWRFMGEKELIESSNYYIFLIFKIQYCLVCKISLLKYVTWHNDDKITTWVRMAKGVNILLHPSLCLSE